MTETIIQMQKRHKTEIKSLQTDCTHPRVSKWLRQEWAPAHSTGFEVKVCETCGKTIAKRTYCHKCGRLTENPQNGIGTNSRPMGAWYCQECIERTPEEIASDSKEEKRLKKSLSKMIKVSDRG